MTVVKKLFYTYPILLTFFIEETLLTNYRHTENLISRYFLTVVFALIILQVVYININHSFEENNKCTNAMRSLRYECNSTRLK